MPHRTEILPCLRRALFCFVQEFLSRRSKVSSFSYGESFYYDGKTTSCSGSAGERIAKRLRPYSPTGERETPTLSMPVISSWRMR